MESQPQNAECRLSVQCSTYGFLLEEQAPTVVHVVRWPTRSTSLTVQPVSILKTQLKHKGQLILRCWFSLGYRGTI